MRGPMEAGHMGGELSVGQAARYLGVSPRQLMRLAHSRRVFGSRTAGVWRFRRFHLDRYVDGALVQELDRRMAATSEDDSIPLEDVIAKSRQLP